LFNPARLAVVLTAVVSVLTAVVVNLATGGQLVPVRSVWWPILILALAVTVALLVQHENGDVLPSRPAGSPDHAGAEDHVFLCHAVVDLKRVSTLYDSLIEAGIRPWMAERDLGPGQDWKLEIKRALRRSRIVVVLLSTSAVSHTGYVQREIREALDLAALRPPGEVFIIPARLEHCDVPDRLQDLQWVDLYRRGGRQRLISAILHDVGKAPQSARPGVWSRLKPRWMVAGTSVLALLGWFVAAMLASPPAAGSVECEKSAFTIDPGTRIYSMRCVSRYALVQIEGDVNVKGTQSLLYRATARGWQLAATGSTTHGALSCGDLEAAGVGHENIPLLFRDYPFVCPSP
jgi:hypothetical protein